MVTNYQYRQLELLLEGAIHRGGELLAERDRYRETLLEAERLLATDNPKDDDKAYDLIRHILRRDSA